MMSFDASPLVEICVFGFVAFEVICLSAGLWWLTQSLANARSQLKGHIGQAQRALRDAADEAANQIGRAATDNGERVRELVRELRVVEGDIANLIPEDMRTALYRVAKLHAQDMTEEFRVKAMQANQCAATYQTWLRALTGGPHEFAAAAMKGYPTGLPEDLAGRLDAVASQRRMTVAGRSIILPFDGNRQADQSVNSLTR